MLSVLFLFIHKPLFASSPTKKRKRKKKNLGIIIAPSFNAMFMRLPDKTDEKSLELQDWESALVLVSQGDWVNPVTSLRFHPPPVQHRGSCGDLERPLPLFHAVTLWLWLSPENTSKITISQQADYPSSKPVNIYWACSPSPRTLLSASLWGRKLTLSIIQRGNWRRYRMFNKLAWSHKTSRLQRWGKSLEGVTPELIAGLYLPGAGKFSS